MVESPRTYDSSQDSFPLQGQLWHHGGKGQLGVAWDLLKRFFSFAWLAFQHHLLGLCTVCVMSWDKLLEHLIILLLGGTFPLTNRNSKVHPKKASWLCAKFARRSLQSQRRRLHVESASRCLSIPSSWWMLEAMVCPMFVRSARISKKNGLSSAHFQMMFTQNGPSTAAMRAMSRGGEQELIPSSFRVCWPTVKILARWCPQDS